jgi:hypothetical protein
MLLSRYAARTVAALTACIAATTAHAQAPSAQEIFDKHVTATGGRAAWAAHTSIVSRGGMEAMGMSATVEMVQARPGIVLPVGDVDTGYDGTIGWQIQPGQGASLVTGAPLEAMKQQSNWDALTYAPGAFKSATVIGQVDFEGVKAWQVTVTSPTDQVSQHYFDATSGLKLGESAKSATPMGEMEATNISADYRPVGNLKLPFKQITRMAMGEFAITMSAIELDKADAKAFEPPAEIQALRKP